MPEHLTGPKFDSESLSRLQGVENSADERPTWRGWVLGLGACALFAWTIPHIEFIIRRTRVTLNILPATTMVLTMVLIVLFNLLLAKKQARWGLKRQDLALIFCMTFLMNSLPANGFLNSVVASSYGFSYYTTKENNWKETIYPLVPESIALRDPENLMEKPRPAEWFYAGIPRNEKIPWQQLAVPYLNWCIALGFFMMFLFALAALLQRQWSDRERLPFPMAQIPETMWSGLYSDQNNAHRETQFFKNPIAWGGIAIVFLLHSWNALGDYVPNWVQIPLQNRNLDTAYLTEKPFLYLRPIQMNLYPSVIAFMYLISLEVSFSLWFFYFIVLKLGVLFAVSQGLGENFNNLDVQKPFMSQGIGAMFGLVLAGLYMARGLIFDSLRQALGFTPTDPTATFSPKWIWGLMVAGFTLSIGWMIWIGMSWYWAVLSMILIAGASIGVARLVAEGGILFMKSNASPDVILSAAFTPHGLGAQNYALIRDWSTVFGFDGFRLVPLINLMNALHIGSQARLKLRPLMIGMALATVVALGFSFVSYMRTGNNAPGGANDFGWWFNSEPKSRFNEISNTVVKINTYDEKVKKYRDLGGNVPSSEIPEVARRDNMTLGWMAAGLVIVAVFLVLRTRIFWWPHPIGYVLWMGPQPLNILCFSFFLGWLIKFLIVKFGGQRIYTAWKPFFVGMVLGEALVTIFWILVSWIAAEWFGMPYSRGYSIEYN